MGSLFRSNAGGSAQAAAKQIMSEHPDLIENLRREPNKVEHVAALYSVCSRHPNSIALVYRHLVAEDSVHELGLARAYALADKPTLAVVQYRKLLSGSPSKEVLEELAVVYERLDKFREAEETRARAADY